MNIVISQASESLIADIVCNLRKEDSVEVIGKRRFSDGESYIKVEGDYINKEVVLIHSFVGNVDYSLVVLMQVLSVLKNKGARVRLILPYYAYSRADRINVSGECVTSEVVADIIKGFSNIISIVLVDIHSNYTKGYLGSKAINLTTEDLFCTYFKNKDLSNTVVVSPDFGAISRCSKLAKKLGLGLAVISKTRTNPNENKVNFLWGDVKGKDIIIYDDIIDTAGTICKSVDYLVTCGVKKVFVCATHPVFSGDAYKNIINSKIEEMVVTNTLSVNDRLDNKFKVISVYPLIKDFII